MFISRLLVPPVQFLLFLYLVSLRARWGGGPLWPWPVGRWSVEAVACGAVGRWSVEALAGGAVVR